MAAEQTPAPAATKLTGKLVVFHAGSLAVPLKAIATAFNKEHPELVIQLEAAGSRDCARKVSELKRPCDVLASADYQVIEQLLIPVHADWNIRFATNEMALVYHEKSRRSNEINDQNWPRILLDEKVAFARSNPNSDPCGYRAVLTMKLAEKFYKQPGLAEKLFAKDTRYLRPKETDLLGLLESGSVDFIFLYRSVAIQHKLKYLTLPDAINLKSAERVDEYAAVSVKLSGSKPGEFVEQKGEPMVYGVTIPKAAGNPSAARAFVHFLLDTPGRKILEEMGQPSAVPSPATNYDRLPEELKPFATDFVGRCPQNQ